MQTSGPMQLSFVHPELCLFYSIKSQFKYDNNLSTIYLFSGLSKKFKYWFNRKDRNDKDDKKDSKSKKMSFKDKLKSIILSFLYFFLIEYIGIWIFSWSQRNAYGFHVSLCKEARSKAVSYFCLNTYFLVIDHFLLIVNFSGMEKLQELDKEIQEQEK